MASAKLRRAAAAAMVVLAGLAGVAGLRWLQQPKTLTVEPASASIVVDAQRLRRAQQMEDLMLARGPIGGPFALVDHKGVRRTLADFRGQVVLLYFGYTSCPDACPTDLAQIAEMLTGFGAGERQIQPIFITIDPERDTVELLRDYVPHFHPRLVGLTGSVEQIRDVADRYKAYFAKVPLKDSTIYMMDHSANIYLLDREGRFQGSLPPGTKASRLASVVRQMFFQPANTGTSDPVPRNRDDSAQRPGSTLTDG